MCQLNPENISTRKAELDETNKKIVMDRSRDFVRCCREMAVAGVLKLCEGKRD